MFATGKETNIIKDSGDVDETLFSHFGLTKEDFFPVVSEAVSARNEATLFHPINSPGTLSHHHATAALRSGLHAKGWKIIREDGVEASFSPEYNIKMAFQNVDCAAFEGRTPQAISNKGAATKQLIDECQGDLFEGYKVRSDKQSTTEFWYFFVSNEQGRVCAELSRPKPFEGGNFAEFDMRIFVVQDGEWNNSDPLRTDVLPPIDVPVVVTRK